MMRNYGMGMFMPVRKGDLVIPGWIVGMSVLFFFIAFAACSIVWGYPMEMRDAIIASLSIILFFYAGRSFSISWQRNSEKTFVRNILWVGFAIRMVWVLYNYFFFNPSYHNNTYGDTADVDWYMPFGEAIAQWIRNGFDVPFSNLIKEWHSAIDDIGYPMWLAIEYLLTGSNSDVFVPFVVKAFVSAYCAVLIYNIANRHYGVGTARLAAIFVMLNPNMIYWCGNMFKETEMVFLCCLAIDNFDRVLSSGKRFTFKNLLPGMLAGLALFFFRSALGAVFFMAVFAHVVMASNRVLSVGKKIIAGVLVAATLLVAMGDRIRTQSQDLIEKAQSDYQDKNMEWRAERKGGNSFAKYAGAAVFAPLIFTIPFPTFNAANNAQVLQMQLSGGSYIKNIFSFFVILVMILMLISGEWRRHVFIIAYTVGYLVVLVMSEFAQSGRFHMPIWPMLMLFAAYGIQIAKGNTRIRRGYTIVLVAEVFVCLAWNWFKLKGRGMI